MPAVSEVNLDTAVEQVRHIATGYAARVIWFGKPNTIPADEFIVRESTFASTIPEVSARDLLIPSLLFIPRGYYRTDIPEGADTEVNRGLVNEIIRTSQSSQYQFRLPPSAHGIPHSLSYFHGWWMHTDESYLSLISRTRILASIVFGIRYSAYILAHGIEESLTDTWAATSTTYQNLKAANLLLHDFINLDVADDRITSESANKLVLEFEKNIHVGDTSISISDILENLRNED